MKDNEFTSLDQFILQFEWTYIFSSSFYKEGMVFVLYFIIKRSKKFTTPAPPHVSHLMLDNITVYTHLVHVYCTQMLKLRIDGLWVDKHFKLSMMKQMMKQEGHLRKNHELICGRSLWQPINI